MVLKEPIVKVVMAGIMTQIPHEFILLHGIPVPERGKYGTGLVFLPKDLQTREMCLEVIR